MTVKRQEVENARQEEEQARAQREAGLREAIRRYEQEVRLFEGIASTTPDFVYLFDRQGRFLYANRRLLDVWGVQLADAVGKTCRELGYEQWHHDMHMREIAQVIETRQPIKGEVPFKAALTGIFGVYEYIFTPVLGPEGDVEVIAGTTRDVTDRKRTEEALERATERLTDVLNSIQDDFYVLDRDWNFTYASRRFTSRVGKQPLDFVGKNLWTMFPAHLGTAFEENLRAAMDRAETRRFEIRGKYTDAWYRMTVFPSKEGITVLGTEITEARRMEEALRAANADLVEADRRKTEFLAVLSHELRNPLAPIRNSIYLLERAAPDSVQATRAREVVRRQTEHLTRLVDDLLDITRISHGKIPLQRSRVDLREIVRKATDDLHTVFTRAGLTLRVDYVTVGPMWVDADPTRISQTLTNLLNNSIKFTPSGGAVRVSVGAHDGRAELSVSDDGIGMDPRDIEHMFEPFAQASQTLARSKGGLGLGLALVKSIVELHGGSVSARSEGPGRGSEFIVRLPLVAAEPQSMRDRPVHASATSQTILVIEDNADGAQSLAEILELHGHRVRVARDGRSGIALAREVQPDVILCDIGLPDVDGYDVARTLRQDGPLRETRLIALSGYAQPEDRRRARDAGFDAHLVKPIALDELMSALNEDG